MVVMWFGMMFLEELNRDEESGSTREGRGTEFIYTTLPT
jgi:hypothetical protein